MIIRIEVHKCKSKREKSKTKAFMVSFEKGEKLSIKIEVLNIILNRSLSLLLCSLQAPAGICPENRLWALSAYFTNWLRWYTEAPLTGQSTESGEQEKKPNSWHKRKCLPSSINTLFFFLALWYTNAINDILIVATITIWKNHLRSITCFNLPVNNVV